MSGGKCTSAVHSGTIETYTNRLKWQVNHKTSTALNVIAFPLSVHLCLTGSALCDAVFPLCVCVCVHSQRPLCNIRWFTKDKSSSTWRNAEAKCSISYAVNLGNLTVRRSGRWKTWSSITQIPGALLGRTRRKSGLCFNLASVLWESFTWSWSWRI